MQQLKHMPKYTFHFRQSDWPLLFTDIVFSLSKYGKIDYRVLQQEDNVVGYLTQKGLKQARKIGLKLLNKKFAKNVIKKLNNIDKRLEDKDILNIKQNSLVSQWEQIESVQIELCNFYIYCEHIVLAPLEEIIYKTCGSADKLIKILKNPKGIDDLNFSEKEQQILNLLVQLGKLKFSIHNKLDPWFDVLYKLNKIIAKNYNLSIKQVSMLRCAELKKVLRGKPPNVDVLNKRVKGCVFLPLVKNKKRRWHCLTGKNFNIWQKKLEQIYSNKIIGSVAYSGKAKGLVKIHTSFSKATIIPKKSIIVAGMTNPQLLPFLKNASAIVTDEGGLTCHAAIISRELKIPCIVGTGNATKVLKNGDLVEVDANKGVVKILKHQK